MDKTNSDSAPYNSVGHRRLDVRPEEPKEIHVALGNLESITVRIEVLSKRLQERLAPVSSSNPKSVGEKDPSRSFNTPIAESIGIQAERLSSTANFLEYIIASLEI